MTQQSLVPNNIIISMMAGRSVPIVSQTEIYSDEMALPPARSHTTAVTEPPPRAPRGRAASVGPQQLGRVAAAESIRVR